MIKNHNSQLDEFLSAYPAEVALLAHQACLLIRQFMPDALELIDRSADLIAYGTDSTYKGLICGITIHKAHINIMFARGASLPDPDNVLLGAGKKARHIKITYLHELDNPGVRRLLEVALNEHQRMK